MINAALLAIVCFLPVRASVRRGVRIMSARYFHELPPPTGLRFHRTRSADGALFGALIISYWVALDVHQDVLPIIAYIIFVSTLVAQGFIDLFTHYLPRLYSWLATLVCGALVTLHALVEWNFERLIEAAVSMVALTIVMMILGVVSRGGIGGGDVYLAPLLGFMLGFSSFGAVMRGTFAGFFLGALFAIVLLLKGYGTKHRFAFGPFLIIGAIWALTT